MLIQDLECNCKGGIDERENPSNSVSTQAPEKTDPHTTRQGKTDKHDSLDPPCYFYSGYNPTSYITGDYTLLVTAALASLSGRPA